MKTTLVFILLVTAYCILPTADLFSQPYYNGFNYQAAIRDGNGDILANENVSVRFSIRQTPTPFNIRYQEVHATTTSESGLVNLVIGSGTVTQFTWSNVYWGIYDYIMQVEVDTGNGYVDMGTSAFKSVPFALRAQLATDMYMLDLVDVEFPSPLADGQVLRFNADEGWFQNQDIVETQTLDVSGANISISSGNTVNLGQWSRSGNANLLSTDFLGTTGAQDLRIKTNGLDRMRITDIGRVGIGTISPQQALHLHSASASAYQMFTNSTTGTSAFSDGLLVGSANSVGYLWNYEDGDLYLGTNGTTRATIKNDGKVGIGTATPDEIFHVQDDDWQLHLENTSGNFWNIGASGSSWGVGNSKLVINNGTSSSSAKMVIDQNGNVGIGITSPVEALEVDGTARLALMDNTANDPLCNLGLRTVHVDCNGTLLVGDEYEDGYYYAVNPTDFVPTYDGTDYFINFSGELEVQEGDLNNVLYAPVHLPHNAYILEVKAYVSDYFADGNLTISLEIDNYVNSNSSYDSATTTGTSGNQVLTIDPSGVSTVHNNTDRVFIRAFVEQSADPLGTIKIKGIHIKYRLG